MYAYILMGDLFSDELSELTSYPDDELTGYYCTYEISESPKFRVRPEIPWILALGALFAIDWRISTSKLNFCIFVCQCKGLINQCPSSTLHSEQYMILR